MSLLSFLGRSAYQALPPSSSIDVPWSVAETTLANALICPKGLPSPSTGPPVLLVHGTAASGQDTWSNTYVPALSADGFTPCYVELPDRAGADMQVSAEYIAHSIISLSASAGGRTVGVVTHSQGGPDTQWAMAWWPSTWSLVSAFFAISPDFEGLISAKPLFSLVCPVIHCPPSVWQQLQGSEFIRALRKHNFKANVPTTTIWTKNDEIVVPPKLNAQLQDARVIGVQEVCPNKVVEHVLIIADALVYALALDVLRNGAHANISDVFAQDPAICSRDVQANMSSTDLSKVKYIVDGIFDGFFLNIDRALKEPPLKAYAMT